MTLNEYVKKHGFKVTDLTDDELRQAQEELDVINGGGRLIDSVFDSPELIYRKMRKESK